MSCSAVVRPASPMTYADPPGRWSSRNWAVASAEVQMDSIGTSSPMRRSRACRSRGVYIELLVRTRKGVPRSWSLARNSAAPGIGSCSRTSTPSMSISQERISRRCDTGTMMRVCAAGGPGAEARDPLGSDPGWGKAALEPSAAETLGVSRSRASTQILGDLNHPGENLEHQESGRAVEEMTESLDLLGVRVMALLHIQGEVPVQQRQRSQGGR